MYLNGMGFRGIKRVTGIAHTTIMNWVKELGEELPEDELGEPERAALDELQTFDFAKPPVEGCRNAGAFIDRKTDKIWTWTAINHHSSGIIAMEIGSRSGKTFDQLWQRIKIISIRLTVGHCQD